MRGLRLSPIPTALRRALGGAASLLPGFALANPGGAVVVGGSVQISAPTPDGLVINQVTDHAAINWQSFSIGADEYVQFVQPSSSAIALNRVVGNLPSEIFGQLSANGRVFLVNPQGVVFGAGAQVDVGGLVATSLDLDPAAFMAGQYVFTDGGVAGAGVVNQGLISADGGFVVLAGDYVHNTGVVHAQLGEVLLASGSALTLDFEGDGLIGYRVDAAALSNRAGVSNAGQILADGGRVVMTAQVQRELVATVVNNSGLVRAQGIAERDGVIELVAAGGDATLTSTLDASNRSGSGGQVQVRGDGDIRLEAGSRIDASGTTAGGVVQVVAADRLETRAGSVIQASASAGPGGFIEVSGHGSLMMRGDVQTGAGGTVLIDPATITVADGTGASSGSSDVTIFEQQLEQIIASGSQVRLVATDSIFFNDLTDNQLNGTAGGGGGSLLVGIGSIVTAQVVAPFYQRGAGVSGGGIFFEDVNDALVVDRGLTLIGGSQAGSIRTGSLQAASVSIVGVEDITVGDIITLRATGESAGGGLALSGGAGLITLGDVNVSEGRIAITGSGDIATGRLIIDNQTYRNPDQDALVVECSGCAITVSDIDVAALGSASSGADARVRLFAGTGITTGSISTRATGGSSGSSFIGDADGSVMVLTNAGSINVQGPISAAADTRPGVGNGSGSANASVTIGDGSSDGAAIAVTTGAISTSATGSGSNFGSVTVNARDGQAGAFGNVTTGVIDAGGQSVDIDGATVQVAGFAAGQGVVTLDASGALAVTSGIDALSIALGAGASIDISGGALASRGFAGITLTAAGDIRAEDVNTLATGTEFVSANVQMTAGGSITLGDLSTSAAGGSSVSARASLTAGSGLSVASISTSAVTGAGTAALGDATLTLQSGGPIQVSGPIQTSAINNQGLGSALASVNVSGFGGSSSSVPVSIQLGDVTALAVTGGGNNGNADISLIARNAFGAAGDLTTGVLTATESSIQLSGANIAVASLSSGGGAFNGITVSATGTFATGTVQDLTAGVISIQAGSGDLVLGNLTTLGASIGAGLFIGASNGAIQTGNLSLSNGSGSISALNGAVQTGDILVTADDSSSSASLRVSATGDIQVGDISTSHSNFSAAANVSLQTTGGSVTAGDIVTQATAFEGPGSATVSVVAATGIQVNQIGTLAQGTQNAAASVTLSTQAGNISVLGGIGTAANANASASSAAATSAVTVDALGGGDVTLGDVSTNASGNTRNNAISINVGSGGSSTAGAVTTGVLTATNSAISVAGAAVSISALSAGSSVEDQLSSLFINAGTFAIGTSSGAPFSLTAGQIDLRARDGNLVTGDLATNNGGISLLAGGDVQTGDLATSDVGGLNADGQLSITAGGGISTGTLQTFAGVDGSGFARARISLSAGTTLDTGPIAASAQSGFGNFAGLADATVVLNALGSRIAVTGDITSAASAQGFASGTQSLAGVTLIGAASGGTAITVNSISTQSYGGSIGISDVVVDAGSNAAAGDITIGSIAAANGSVTLAGGDIQVNSLSGGSSALGDVVATARGGLDLGTADLTARSLRLSAGQGDLLTGNLTAAYGGITLFAGSGDIVTGNLTSSVFGSTSADASILVTAAAGSISVGAVDATARAFGSLAGVSAAVVLDAASGVNATSISTSAVLFGSSSFAPPVDGPLALFQSGVADGSIRLSSDSGSISVSGLISSSADGATLNFADIAATDRSTDGTAVGILLGDVMTGGFGDSIVLDARDLSVSGVAGDVAAGNVTTRAGTVQAFGNDVQLGTLSGGASNQLLAINAQALGTLTLAQTDLTAGTITLAAGNGLTVGDLTATSGSLSLVATGGNLVAGDLSASDTRVATISATATAGSVSVGAVSAFASADGGFGFLSTQVNLAGATGVSANSITSTARAGGGSADARVILLAGSGGVSVAGAISSQAGNSSSGIARAGLTVDDNVADAQAVTVNLGLINVGANGASSSANILIDTNDGTGTAAGDVATSAVNATGANLTVSGANVQIGRVGGSSSALANVNIGASGTLTLVQDPLGTPTPGDVYAQNIALAAGAGTLLAGNLVSVDGFGISAVNSGGDVVLGDVTLSAGSSSSATTGIQLVALGGSVSAADVTSSIASSVGNGLANASVAVRGDTGISLGAISATALTGSGSGSADARVTLGAGSGAITVTGDISTVASVDNGSTGRALAGVSARDIVADAQGVDVQLANVLTRATSPVLPGNDIVIDSGFAFPAAGDVSTGNLTAINGGVLVSGNALNLGAVSGGTTAGQQLTTLDLQALSTLVVGNTGFTAERIRIAAGAGDLSFAALTATAGGITVTNSGGGIQTGALSASDGGSAANASITLQSVTGSIATGTIQSTATSPGSAQAVVSLDAATGLSTGAITTQALVTGSGSANASLSLQNAQGLLTVSGPVNLQADVSGVAGASQATAQIFDSNLDGLGVIDISLGDVRSTATGGSARSSSQTINALSGTAVSGDLLAFDATSLSVTGSDITVGRLRADGGVISVSGSGDVTVASIASGDGSTAASVSLSALGALSGPSDVVAGSISLSAGIGGLSVGALTAIAGGVNVNVGTGDLLAGSVSASGGGITLRTNAGNVQAGALQADTAVDGTSAAISVTATGGAITLDTVQASATAAGSFAGATASVILSAGTGIDVTSITTSAAAADGGADATVALRSEGGAINVLGGVDATAIAGGSGGAFADISFVDGAQGQGASPSITVGDLSAQALGGQVRSAGLTLDTNDFVAAAGNISTGVLSTSGGNISVTGGNVVVQDISQGPGFAPGNVSLIAAGTLSGPAALTAGSINLSAGVGGLGVGALTALAGGVSVSVGSGLLDAGDISATGGTITLFNGGGDIQAGSLQTASSGPSANGSINVISSTGAITVAGVQASATGTSSFGAATANVILDAATGVAAGPITTQASGVIASAAATVTAVSDGGLVSVGDISTSATTGGSSFSANASVLLGENNFDGTAASVLSGAITANASATAFADSGITVTANDGLGGSVTTGALTTAGSAISVSGADVTVQGVGASGGLDPSSVSLIASGLLDGPGTITAGSITLAAGVGGLSVGALTATAGDVVTTVSGGNLLAGDVLASGTVNLFTSGGNLQVGQVSASGGTAQLTALGNLTAGAIDARVIGVSAGGDVALDTLDALNGSISVTSGGGAITAAAIDAGAGGIALQAQNDIQAGSLTALAAGGNADVLVTSTAGSVSVGAVSATAGALVGSASAAVRLTGATGVSAASINTSALGGAGGLANASVALISGGGTIAALGGISTFAMGDVVGAANADVDIFDNNGGDGAQPIVIVGDIDTLAVGGGTSNRIRIDQSFSGGAVGDITTGALNAFDSSVSLVGNTVSIGGIGTTVAVTDAAITADGSVTSSGDITANTLTLSAGNGGGVGTIDLQNVTALGASVSLSVINGSLSAGNIVAAGDLNLTNTTGDISTADLTASGGSILVQAAAGDISTGNLLALQNLTVAGNDVLLGSFGGVGGANLGQVDIQAQGTLTQVTSSFSADAIRVAAGAGDLSFGALSARNGSASLSTGSGNLTLGDLSVSGGRATLDAGGSLVAGDISVTGGIIDISGTTGSIQTGDLSTSSSGADADARILLTSATGSISTGAVQATASGSGAVQSTINFSAVTGLSTGGITTSAQSAGGSAEASVTLSTLGGTLSAAGPIDASAIISGASGGLASAFVIAGDTVTGGTPVNLALGDVSTLASGGGTRTNDIVLDAEDGPGGTRGNIVAGDLTAGNAAISVIGNNVQLGALSAGTSAGAALRAVVVDAAGTLAIGNSSFSAGNIALTGGSGNLTLGALTATQGGVLVSVGGGDLTLGDVAATGGSVNLSTQGGDIQTGDLQSVGGNGQTAQVTVNTSGAGSLAVGAVSASSSGSGAADARVRLNAGGGISAGPIQATANVFLGTASASVGLLSETGLIEVAGDVGAVATASGGVAASSVLIGDAGLVGGAVILDLDNVSAAATVDGGLRQSNITLLAVDALDGAAGDVTSGNLLASVGDLVVAGQDLSLGTLSAGAPGAAFGRLDIQAQGALSVSALTGDLAATSILLRGASGALDLGALTATAGNVELELGSGGFTLGDLSATGGSVSVVTGSGDILAGDASANGGAIFLTTDTGTVSAGALQTQGGTAGDVRVTAGGGSLSLDSVSAQALGAGGAFASVTLQAGTGLSVAGGISTAAAAGSGAIADASVTLANASGAVQVLGPITTSATSVSGALGTANARVQVVDPNNGDGLASSILLGNVQTAAAAAASRQAGIELEGRDLLSGTAANITTGNLSADAASIVIGGNDISLGSLGGGSQGALLVVNVSAAGSLSLAPTAVVAQGITLSAAGGDLSAGDLTATAGSIRLLSGGDLGVGNLSTTGALGSGGAIDGRIDAQSAGSLNAGAVQTTAIDAGSAGAIALVSLSGQTGVSVASILSQAQSAGAGADASVSLQANNGLIAVLGGIQAGAQAGGSGSALAGVQVSDLGALDGAASFQLGDIGTLATGGALQANDILLSGAQAAGASVVAGDLTASNASITVTGGDVQLGALSGGAGTGDALGAVVIDALGSLSLGTTAFTADTILIRAGSGFDVGDLTALGGQLALVSGGNLSAGTLTSVGGDLSVQGADLALGGLSGGGSALDQVQVLASGTLSLIDANVSAGDIDIASGAGALNLGNLEALTGGVNVSAAGGSLLLGTVTATGGALGAGSVLLNARGNLGAGDISTLDATDASVTLTGGGRVAVGTIQTLASSSAAAAAGRVTIDAGTNLIAGAINTQATSGAGSADAGATLLANTGVRVLGGIQTQANAGGGALALAGVSITDANPGDALSPGVLVGDITTVANGASGLADIGILVDGDISTGALTATGASIGISGNNVSLGALSGGAGGELLAVDVLAAGTLDVAMTDFVAGSVSLQAQGSSLSLGSVTATTGDLSLVSGGNVSAGNLSAANGIATLTAAGDLAVGDLSTPSFAIQAGGDVTLGTVTGTSGTLVLLNDATVAQDLSIGSFVFAGPAAVSFAYANANLAFGNVSVGGSFLASTGTGSLSVGSLDAGTDATLTALTGALVLQPGGALSTGGNLSLTSGENLDISAASFDVGGGFTASAVDGSSLTVGDLVLSGPVTLNTDSDLTAGDIGASVIMTTAGDDVLIGRLTAQDLQVTAGGDVTLAGVNVSESVSVVLSNDATSIQNLSIGDLVSDGVASAEFVYANANLAFGAVEIIFSGFVASTGSGSLSVADVSAGGSVRLAALTGGLIVEPGATLLSGGDLTLISGEDLDLSGSVVDSVAGPISVSAVDGSSLTVGDLFLVSDSSFNADRDLTVGNLTAVTDSISLAAGGDLFAARVQAADVNLSAGGAVTIGQLSADNGLDLTLSKDSTSTQNLSIGALSVPGLSLQFVNANIDIGSLSALQDVLLSTANGNLSIGNLSVFNAAGAGATLIASTGQLSLSPGGLLRTAGDLSLTSGENLDISGASFDVGGGLTASAVDGSSLTVGELLLTGPVTLDADSDLTARDIGASSITATAGNDVLTGALNAGDVSISAGGDVNLGALTVGNSLQIGLANDATAAQNLSIASVDYSGADALVLDYASANLDVGGLTTGGDATVRSDSGNVQLGDVDVGGLAILGTQSGALSFVTGSTVDATDLNLSSGIDLDLASIAFTVANDLTAAAQNGASLTAGDVAVAGALQLSAGGTLTTGDLSAAALNLGAGSTLSTGDLDAADIAVQGGADVMLGTVTASNSVSVILTNDATTAQNLTIGGLAFGGTTPLSFGYANANLAFGAVSTGGAFSVSIGAGNLSIGSLDSGTDATLTASTGALSLLPGGLLRTGGDLSLTSGEDLDISAASFDVGGGFTASAVDGSSLTVGDLLLAGPVVLSADAAIGAGTVTASAINASAGGDLFTGELRAADIALSAGGDVQANGVAVSGDFSLVLTNDATQAQNVEIGTLVSTSGTDLVLSYANANLLLGSIDVSGNVQVSLANGALGIGTLDAAGNATLSTVNGALSLIGGSLITRGDLTLTTGQDLDLRPALDVLANGTFTVVVGNGGSLIAGDLFAPGDLVFTAGGDITTGDLGAFGMQLSAGNSVQTGALTSRDLAIVAGGDVSLAGATVTNSLDVVLSNDFALSQNLSIGTLQSLGSAALNLDYANANLVFGNVVTFGSFLASTGTGSLSIGGLNTDADATLTAITGALVLLPDAQLTTGGDLSLTSGEDLDLGTTGFDVGGTLTVAAIDGASLTAGDLLLAGPVVLSADGDLSTGDIGASAVSATAGGNVQTGSLSAADVGIVAGGDVTLVGVDVSNSFAVLLTQDATAAQTLSIGSLASSSAADTSLSYANANLSLGLVDVAAGFLASTLNGSLSVGSVSAGTDATLAASTGALSLLPGGLLSTGGDLSLTSGEDLDISAASFDVGGGFTASAVDGSSLAVGDLLLTGAVGLNADDALTAGDVSALGIVANAGGDLQTGVLTAGTISVGAGGDVTLAGVDAGNSLTVDLINDATTTQTLDVASLVYGGAAPLQLDYINANLALGDLASASAVVLATQNGSVTVRDGSTLQANALSITSGQGLDLDAVQILATTQVELIALNGALSAGDLSASNRITATADGAVNLGSLSAATVQAMAGTTLTTGNVAGSDLLLEAGGDVNLGALTVGNSLQIGLANDATAAQNLSIASVDYSGAGALVLDYARANLDVGSVTTGGDATVRSGSGNVQLGDVDVGGLAILGTQSGALSFVPGSTVDATDLNLSSGIDLDLASIAFTVANNLTAAAQNGAALTAGNVAVAGALQLSADGTLTTGDLSAAALDLGAGSTMSTGTLTAADIAVQGGADVLLGAVTVSNSLAVTLANDATTAQNLAIASITSTGADSLLLDYARANLALGDIVTAGDLTVRSGSGAVSIAGLAVQGAATVGSQTGALTVADGSLLQAGDLSLTSGQDLNLATAAPRFDVAGTLNLSALNGASLQVGDIGGADSPDVLILSAQDSLVAGSLQAGTLSLSAVGDLSAADLAGTSVNLASGGDVELGTVSAQTFSASLLNDASLAQRLAIASLTLPGDVNLSYVNADLALASVTAGGDVSIASSNGDLTLGDLDAGGDASLGSGSGVLTLLDGSTLGAQNLSLSSGSDLDLRGRILGFDVAGQLLFTTVNGAALAVGNLQTIGALDLVSSGTLTAGNLQAADIGLDAAGALTAGTLSTTAGAVTADNDAGTVALGTINAAGAVSVTAAGTATLAGITAGGPVSLSSDTGGLTVGNVQGGAGADITLLADLGTVDGDIITGLLGTGGDVLIRGGTVQVGGLAGVTGDGLDAVQIAASGTLEVLGPAISAQSLTLAAGAGSLNTGDLNALGGALSLTNSGGAISAGALVATGAVVLDARTNLLTAAVSGQTLDLSAGGTLTASDLDAVGVLQASAGGSLSAAAVTAGGDASLAAGGLLAVDAVMAGGTASLAGNGISGAGVSASGLTANAGSGDLVLGDLNIGAGGIALAVQDVAARRVQLGDVLTTGALALGGTQYGLTAGDIQASSISLDFGSGAVSVGNLVAAGAVDLAVQSGALSFGDIQAGTIDLSVGHAFDLGAQTLQATGDLAVVVNGALGASGTRLLGDTVSVQAAGPLGLAGVLVGRDADGALADAATLTGAGDVTLTGSQVFADTIQVTSQTGSVTLDGSVLDPPGSSLIEILAQLDIHLDNGSLLEAPDGTVRLTARQGLIDTRGTASTIRANALSVQAATIIDLALGRLEIGSGLADFGGDNVLAAALAASNLPFLPGSTTPNAAFSAAQSVTLGDVEIGGGYLFVQTGQFSDVGFAQGASVSSSGGNVLLGFAQTDPAADLQVASVVLPAGVTSVVFGGSQTSGDIVFEPDTPVPSDNNVLIFTSGEVINAPALRTEGEVVVLSGVVRPMMPGVEPPPPDYFQDPPGTAGPATTLIQFRDQEQPMVGGFPEGSITQESAEDFQTEQQVLSCS